MKPLHVHVSVDDVAASIRFYNTLFAAEPVVAETPVLDEGATTWCYARSEKSWIEDPQGVKWETFHTTGESTSYGTDEPAVPSPSRCCGPSRAA